MKKTKKKQTKQGKPFPKSKNGQGAFIPAPMTREEYEKAFRAPRMKYYGCEE